MYVSLRSNETLFWKDMLSYICISSCLLCSLVYRSMWKLSDLTMVSWILFVYDNPGKNNDRITAQNTTEMMRDIFINENNADRDYEHPRECEKKVPSYRSGSLCSWHIMSLLMPPEPTYVGFDALAVRGPRRSNSMQYSVFSANSIGRFTIPPRLRPGTWYLHPGRWSKVDEMREETLNHPAG